MLLAYTSGIPVTNEAGMAALRGTPSTNLAGMGLGSFDMYGQYYEESPVAPPDEIEPPIGSNTGADRECNPNIAYPAGSVCKGVADAADAQATLDRMLGNSSGSQRPASRTGTGLCTSLGAPWAPQVGSNCTILALVAAVAAVLFLNKD